MVDWYQQLGFDLAFTQKTAAPQQFCLTSVTNFS